MNAPIETNPEPRASIFTAEQEAQLRRMKAWAPYRIIWGAINPDTQEFYCGADYDRRKLNAALRKGHLVATIG